MSERPTSSTRTGIAEVRSVTGRSVSRMKARVKTRLAGQGERRPGAASSVRRKSASSVTSRRCPAAGRKSRVSRRMTPCNGLAWERCPSPGSGSRRPRTPRAPPRRGPRPPCGTRRRRTRRAPAPPARSSARPPTPAGARRPLGQEASLQPVEVHAGDCLRIEGRRHFGPRRTGRGEKDRGQAQDLLDERARRQLRASATTK